MAKSDDTGLPLFEAIRTYSDPSDWAELENLVSVSVTPAEKEKWTPDEWARYDFKIKHSLGLAFPGSQRPLGDNYLQAWHRWIKLRTAFHQRLQSGEFVVTGYVEPVKAADQRTVIQAGHWRVLEPDFCQSMAVGGGMKVLDVHVHPPELNAEAKATQLADGPPPETHSGMPGRPSAKHLYLQELERRVEARQMCDTIAGESRELHDWLKKRHPDLNPNTPKTIENNIRKRYRQLRGSPENKPPE